MRALLALCLAHCAVMDAEPLETDLGRTYSVCEHGDLDIARENAPAIRLAAEIRGRHGMAFDAIIVPGFTPRQGFKKDVLHPYAKERLLRAVLDWRKRLAPFFVLSGGDAILGADNEAMSMKRYLVRGGIPEERIFVEPCALHSHTNLRNSGRLLMANGLRRALIVTSYDQAFYFTHGWLTGFLARQMKQLGYRVGDLTRYDAQRVVFMPSRQNFRPGKDALDP